MRNIAERLLFVLFALVRTACLVQGLALAAALLAGPVVNPATASAWLVALLGGSIRVGGALVATGVAIILADRWIRPAVPEATVRGAVWPAALGLSLVLLSALALVRSTGLLALWSLVAGLLDEAGFGETFTGGQGGGPVMLAILVALLVPILETVEAFFLVVMPVFLLALLAARSASFLKLYAMLVATQIGLVVCGVFAVGTISTLAGEAIASMQASGDADVLPAVEIAGQLRDLVVATAHGYVLPASGFALWLPFLLLRPRSGSASTAGAATLDSPPSV